MEYLPKLIVVGHGQHGKDTFGNMIEERVPGAKSVSSSWFAMERAIWPAIGGEYQSENECFSDRRARRAEWFQLIAAYNAKDPARLARELFKEHSIYTGMRRREEFLVAKKLADLTIWIDRSRILPPEAETSMTILQEDCDVIVDNNGSVEDLALRVARICAAVYHHK